MPRLMLTADALDRLGDRIPSQLEVLAMAPDGTVRAGSSVLGRDEMQAEIAYASGDLFDGGTDGRIRSFFGWLVHTSGLEWMHIAAAGVDNPVFEQLLRSGVRISTSHHTAIPISEYVVAQVLRHRLPLSAMDESQAARRWEPHQWDEVASSRWLVIGLGAIGSAVAVRARAFGAHVTGVRRSPARPDDPVDRLVHPDRLLDEVGSHDVVVLALPATSATVGMVSTEFLARFAPGTILVNVGRGSLVDEDALRHSLDHGRPARAVLDVASAEPLPAGHWLWSHPRVTLTGHTSAGGRQRHERADRIFLDNLASWLDDRTLADEATLADR